MRKSGENNRLLIGSIELSFASGVPLQNRFQSTVVQLQYRSIPPSTTFSDQQASWKLDAVPWA